MSTGNLKPQIPQNLPEELKEVPLSWFNGMGTKDRGIIAIHFSNEFDALFGPELEKHLGQYRHFMGNSFIGDSEVLVKDSSQIQNEENRAIVELAEKRIKEITGFGAKELMAKKHELYDLYRGKHEAPLEVELL